MSAEKFEHLAAVLIENDDLPQMTQAQIMEALGLPDSLSELRQQRLLSGLRCHWARRRMPVENMWKHLTRHSDASAALATLAVHIIDDVPAERIKADAEVALNALLKIEDELYQAVLVQDGGYRKSERFMNLELDL